LDQNQKIRICHLTSVHRASDNRIFFKECRTLSNSYDVILIAPAGKSYRSDNVEVISVKPPPNRLFRFLVTDWILLFKAFRVKASLHHIHDPELIIIGLILKLTGKKIIYDIEEDVRADLAEKKWLPLKSIARILFVLFERLAVKYFYLVLAEESYAGIYNKRTKKFIVVQNFVPIKDIEPGRVNYHPESNKLALVGTLYARRGLPFILEALQILKQRGIIVKLVCVGEKNEAVDRILNASKVWNEIKDQVIFKGYIPFPESIYAVTNCFAGLSLPETLPNHIRSYPTKMFEYMAVGLPVIASDFPLYKDVVEKHKCGISVSSENSHDIASAIEYLYIYKDEAEGMSRNGRKAVVEYDWETEAEKLLKLYNVILGEAN
jgi:glycosyltransferase involved in cell wall biosynthesis